MKKPNIILLMCDQLRGDCLSFADHPDVKHPILIRWLLTALSLKMVIVPVQAAYRHAPRCLPDVLKLNMAE